jgi:hypothetical protein
MVLELAGNTPSARMLYYEPNSDRYGEVTQACAGTLTPVQQDSLRANLVEWGGLVRSLGAKGLIQQESELDTFLQSAFRIMKL